MSREKASGSGGAPAVKRGELSGVRFWRAKITKLSGPPGLRLSGAFLQFAATVFIARMLGDEASGAYFFWAAVLMSSGRVATFGMDKLSLQQVPRLVGGNERALSLFLANVRGIAVGLSLIIGLLLALYALLVQPDISRPYVWYFMLPASIAGVAMCRINGESIKGMGKPMLGVVYRHLAATSIFMVLLLVAGSRLSAEIALGCFTVGFFVAGFAALRGPGFSRFGIGLRCPRVTELREKLSMGLPIFLASLCAALTYIIPLAILERWHASADVAYLTTSYRFFMLFEVLALAVYAVTMPNLSRAAHGNDWGRTASLYRSVIRNGLLILGLPLVLAFLAAPPLMGLFGDGFSEAVPVFRTLLVFRLITLCLGPSEDLMIMVGHSGKLAVFAATRLTCTLLAAPLLIGAYGPTGMALLIGFGMVFQSGLCLWQFRRTARTESGNEKSR